jgi:hypothetical protein
MLHTIFPPPPLGRENEPQDVVGLKVQRNRFCLNTHLHPPPCYSDTSSKAKVKNRFFRSFFKKHHHPDFYKKTYVFICCIRRRTISLQLCKKNSQTLERKNIFWYWFIFILTCGFLLIIWLIWFFKLTVDSDCAIAHWHFEMFFIWSMLLYTLCCR